VLIFKSCIYNYFVHETYINAYDLQDSLYKVMVDFMICDYIILRTVTGLTRNFNLVWEQTNIVGTWSESQYMLSLDSAPILSIKQPSLLTKKFLENVTQCIQMQIEVSALCQKEWEVVVQVTTSCPVSYTAHILW
jgi:hypothetical protein